MSKVSKFLVGLAASLLVGLVAHFVHRDQIAADLTQSAQAALEANYMTWAKISFAGDGPRYRIGKIIGTPPTPESGEEARQIVLRALHNNNFTLNSMLHGGVHAVKFEAAAPMGTRDPYIWRSEVAGAEIILRGNVPDDATRKALVIYAKSAFESKGLSVVDQMTIRANPPEGNWLGAAKRGIDAIAALGNEFAELNDASLSVVGVAKTGQEKTNVEKALSAVAVDGFTPMPAITLPAEITPSAPEPAPEVAAEVDQCQQKIDAVMTNKTVNFDTGKASLKRTPDRLLDRLAEVAGECPGTRIAIVGHTDTRGNETANLQLSEARAETVKVYLAGKGIASDRLTSTGKGESEPLDPADTPEAHEKNRRIEFTVSASN